jgi:uncharacterized protein YbjT (DUF2867 family)
MTRVLVTGATGTLGSALRPRLLAAGHTVRAASRAPPNSSSESSGVSDEAVESGEADEADETAGVEWVELDLLDSTGMETALADVDVVVHAATAPTGDSEAVDVDGTERLLDAADETGVSNFLYPSIVGIEEIPYSYYEYKLAAERAVEASDVPHTVLRATQFHCFLDELLGMVARSPVWPLPTKFRIQPVAVEEVADVLVEHATPDASGRVDPVGGPEEQSLGNLARTYREARGLRRAVVGLPLPGGMARAFRAGHATCPDRAVGTVTWEAWLTERYGAGEATASNPAGSAV